MGVETLATWPQLPLPRHHRYGGNGGSFIVHHKRRGRSLSLFGISSSSSSSSSSTTLHHRKRRCRVVAAASLFPGEDSGAFLSHLRELADAVEPASDVAATVERKANSVELPMSLRMIMIKKKKKKKRGCTNTDTDTGVLISPVKRAFSSMVFIIRELQGYALHMLRVDHKHNHNHKHKVAEINASFVWLFQNIFSCTPTLMLSLMILLSNFTVQSITTMPPAAAAIQQIQHLHNDDDNQCMTSYITNSDDNPGGRTASDGGGGRKARPVAGSTDEGPSSRHHRIRITTTADDDAADVVSEEEEEGMVWSRMVEEAYSMQSASWSWDGTHIDPALMVSPVTVEIEPEEESAYSETEVMYAQALSREPENPLLLANFAHFLYVVLHDHDRAEMYFKRAVLLDQEPADAEVLSRYANFLWKAREDISAAEETYLEAVAAASPVNASYHAANYAHFLWSTGGEDTCYPLDNDEENDDGITAAATRW